MSQSKVHTCRVVISRLELLAGTLFMLALLVLLSVQVVSRYLLSNPLVWTEEISRFIFVWLVMIGAAYVSSVQQHLALTIVTDHLKDRVFDIWMRVISVLVAVASAIVHAWSNPGVLLLYPPPPVPGWTLHVMHKYPKQPYGG